MTITPKHARGLAAAARRIFATHDLPTTLSTIAQAARDALAGIEEAAIALPGRDGQVRGMAATDPLALALEELQHELGEGPSLDVLGERRMVVVNHLPAQFRRWPRYAPQAATLGLRSQMGLPLTVEDRTIGALNLYCTQSDTITPELLPTVDLFVTHAALAIAQVDLEENLTAALRTRKLIGQAIGILMERYELGEDQAFQCLRRLSQDSSLKLRAIALELVQDSNNRTQIPSDRPGGPRADRTDPGLIHADRAAARKPTTQSPATSSPPGSGSIN